MIIFNSGIEVSIRLAFLLNAAFPTPLDVDRLALLDHAVLHSADFGGPESIFPPNPGRVSELTLKRPILHEALHLLTQANVAAIVPSIDGVQFTAGEESNAFLSVLESPLAASIRNRAAWAVGALLDGGDFNVESQLADALESWKFQFSDEGY